MNPLEWDLGNVPPGIVWGGVDGGPHSARMSGAKSERERSPVDCAIVGCQMLHHAAPPAKMEWE